MRLSRRPEMGTAQEWQCSHLRASSSPSAVLSLNITAILQDLRRAPHSSPGVVVTPSVSLPQTVHFISATEKALFTYLQPVDFRSELRSHPQNTSQQLNIASYSYSYPRSLHSSRQYPSCSSMRQQMKRQQACPSSCPRRTSLQVI